MADLARIKGNIRKMVEKGAPEADIDQYIAEEGVTVDEIRGFTDQPLPPPIAEQTLPTDRPMPMGEMADPNLVPKVLPQTQAAYDISPVAGVVSDIGEALQHGGTFGWDEEIGSAMTAAPQAAMDWMRGKGYDFSKHYTPLLQRAEEYTRSRQERIPWTSATTEPFGALGIGAVLSGAGLTTAGRSIPLLSKVAPGITSTLLSAGEGAGYAGLQAAGGAPPGERWQRAKEAAPAGAITGGLLQGTSNVLDRMLATKAANVANAVANPISQDLATAGHALYDAAENEGVRYAPQALQPLGVDIRAAAGRLNPRTRSQTMGFVEDAMDKFSGKQSVSFGDFAEYRQDLNAAIRSPQTLDTDRRTLRAIKDVADDWAGKVSQNPANFTGGNAQKAFEFQRQADQIWAQHEKTKVYEDIIDDIHRKGAGKFTQGGIANAAKDRFESLYKQARKNNFRGYTAEEVKMIRQLAMGGSSNTIVRLLSKFDPKGALSLFTGLTLGGPALTGIGYVTGRMRDQGMEEAAQLLLSGAAGRPVVRPVVRPSKNITPLIPAATLLLSGNKERRQGDRKR